jgi:hypothetical protein
MEDANAYKESKTIQETPPKKKRMQEFYSRMGTF